MTPLRLLLAASALWPVSQAVFADALQQQVLAGAKAVSARDFTFIQTMRFERTGAAPMERVSRYDPRGVGKPWTLMKIDGKPPTPKQMEQDARRASRVPPPSYARIAEWFGAPATRITTTPTSVTYRFASLPKGTIKMGSYDASPNTSAEAVVNIAGKVPFVERARFSSNTPTRLFLVAKLERFVANSTYRLLPDGRPVPSSVATEFSGSMMGKAATMTTRTNYSEFAAAR
ncbi:hypothetical protein [Sphingomonas sp. SUN039]|uniref:hypothetical protein n=1 Tax=Sphingomonas sp. SUN039 TaxID=2937787 RepID=UPI00216492DA|nr:hypothetical protein [Sphingomonas sp. SUN039]UVO54646.1 hypothetical protein M0209_11125 [Sphingomonas sp. SUN039]